MKKALSRILEFIVGHDRREKNHPMHQSYCMCGAPINKPGVEGQKRAVSLKTRGGPQGF
jgi:hypothetical protein